MDIRIDDGGVEVDNLLRAHLERRLAFALGSVGDRVGRVLVRLSHGEPARADPLKRCEIEIMLRPRRVRVADTGANLFIAVENAADRLTRSIDRALDRERAWTDGQPSPPAATRRK